MGKNIGENISKNLSGKYNQKLPDHAKQSAIDVPKTTSKRVTGNKIANKITKISRTPQQNNSETVTNEHDKETPKERYKSPDER